VDGKGVNEKLYSFIKNGIVNPLLKSANCKSALAVKISIYPIYFS